LAARALFVLALRVIDVRIRKLGKPERRDLRKNLDRYVKIIVRLAFLLHLCMPCVMCPSAADNTILKMIPMSICVATIRIPGVLQGRGAFRDLFLDVPLAPLRRAQKEGFLTVARRGKVKFTGPTFLLRFPDDIDEHSLPLPLVRAVPCNILLHHLTLWPVSVGFVFAPPEKPVRVRVPVRTVNAEKSPGIRAGGWVNKLHRAVDIAVAPGVPPPLFVTMDISGMNLKDRKPFAALDFAGKGQGCRTVLPCDTVSTIISKV
jgi:Ribosomal protein TL5, C-terminal domain